MRRTLPQGFAEADMTIIGDRGVNLSGGQRVSVDRIASSCHRSVPISQESLAATGAHGPRQDGLRGGDRVPAG
jgi:hypothetical protein